MTEHRLRADILRYAHAMSSVGWVANHDGNLSVKVTDDRYLITPTAMSKADIILDDLLIVDGKGQRVSGRRKPFSEMALHRIVYERRSDVQAVVHAHPPYATAFGAAGQTLPHPFLPEAVVSLGAVVPTIPLTMPGADGVKAIEPFVRACDAVIVAGNGVFTWGPSLELAFLRMELVEHLARIAHHAHTLGGVKRLPEAMIAELLAKRRKANLTAPDEGRTTPATQGLERLEQRVVDAIGSLGTAGSKRQIEGIVRRVAVEVLKG